MLHSEEVVYQNQVLSCNVPALTTPVASAINGIGSTADIPVSLPLNHRVSPCDPRQFHREANCSGFSSAAFVLPVSCPTDQACGSNDNFGKDNKLKNSDHDGYDNDNYIPSHQHCIFHDADASHLHSIASCIAVTGSNILPLSTALIRPPPGLPKLPRAGRE